MLKNSHGRKSLLVLGAPLHELLLAEDAAMLSRRCEELQHFIDVVIVRPYLSYAAIGRTCRTPVATAPRGDGIAASAAGRLKSMVAGHSSRPRGTSVTMDDVAANVAVS